MTTTKLDIRFSEKRIDKLAAQLTATETKLSSADEAAKTKLEAQRDRLILSMIESGATFSFIAATRGVPASTNRGLIRVLQGGKRL
jgi:hypothetical protein